MKKLGQLGLCVVLGNLSMAIAQTPYPQPQSQDPNATIRLGSATISASLTNPPQFGVTTQLPPSMPGNVSSNLATPPQAGPAQAQGNAKPLPKPGAQQPPVQAPPPPQTVYFTATRDLIEKGSVKKPSPLSFFNEKTIELHAGKGEENTQAAMARHLASPLR